MVDLDEDLDGFVDLDELVDLDDLDDSVDLDGDLDDLDDLDELFDLDDLVDGFVDGDLWPEMWLSWWGDTEWCEPWDEWCPWLLAYAGLVIVSPRIRVDKRIVDFFMIAPLFCDIISEIV